MASLTLISSPCSYSKFGLTILKLNNVETHLYFIYINLMGHGLEYDMKEV